MREGALADVDMAMDPLSYHTAVRDFRRRLIETTLEQFAGNRTHAARGHANPTTTLRHYARWIPSKGRRWVDALDASGSKMWNQEDIHIRIAPEAVGMIGEPSGTRTRDPLIKSDPSRMSIEVHDDLILEDPYIWD